jgi:hypothetical protein
MGDTAPESLAPTFGVALSTTLPAPSTQPGRDLLSGRPSGRPRAVHLTAAAMVGAPLMMTAWFLVEPSVLPREDAEVFLTSVASSPDRYLVGTVLMAVAAALTVVASVGYTRLLRPRLPRLGLVVGILTFLSGLGLAAQVGFRAFVWSLVEPGRVPAASVSSYDTFQHAGLFDVLVAPGLVFGGLATLLTVGAVLVTGLVARWVAVAILVGTVLASGEWADPVTVAGAALVALGTVRLARTLVAQR